MTGAPRHVDTVGSIHRPIALRHHLPGRQRAASIASRRPAESPSDSPIPSSRTRRSFSTLNHVTIPSKNTILLIITFTTCCYISGPWPMSAGATVAPESDRLLEVQFSAACLQRPHRRAQIFFSGVAAYQSRAPPRQCARRAAGHAPRSYLSSIRRPCRSVCVCLAARAQNPEVFARPPPARCGLANPSSIGPNFFAHAHTNCAPPTSPPPAHFPFSASCGPSAPLCQGVSTKSGRVAGIRGRDDDGDGPTCVVAPSVWARLSTVQLESKAGRHRWDRSRPTDRWQASIWVLAIGCNTLPRWR